MKLSVIIVNYNVKHFLEQCLLSVDAAMAGVDGEILVADNRSADGSCAMIREKFPHVRLIENQSNVGFSKANNQCIGEARGEYVLLLNPDTLVPADCFPKCLAFMDSHADAGALGVKMIDGKGRFLPESKRGLPTPWVALCKLSGLTRLFPRSKRLARYYLGHLPEDQTNEVDVLTGAFLFLRRTALDHTGLLDEAFFMYGEDIDLSYRITNAGFRNYYFPATTIVHYKGESTRRGSLNYVKLFYKAMLLFARKHFSPGQNRLFSALINLAIYFRAALSIAGSLAKQAFFPLADALIIFLGFAWLIPFWESVQFEDGHFPPEFLRLVVPGYLVVWLIALARSGAYRRPVALHKLYRGIGLGSVAIMIIYSLLSEGWRFSRTLTLIGIVWTLLLLPLYRFFLSFLKTPFFATSGFRSRLVVLVANPEEAYRISTLLKESSHSFQILGYVTPNDHLPDPAYLGKLDQIGDLIELYRPDELIFSGKDVSSAAIIDCMLDWQGANLSFKIAPRQSLSIIGSNSPLTAGDLYQISVNPLNRRWNRLRKRWLDLKVSGLLIVLFPFIFWLFADRRKLVSNCIAVFGNRKTWIGFAAPAGLDPHLPHLKPGILTTCSPLESRLDHTKKLENDRLYAKNYRFLSDLDILFRNRKNLDR